MEDYRGKVRALGYSLACGVSLVHLADPAAPPSELDKLCLSAILQPLPGSPHPIDGALLAKIRDEVLPRSYQDVPVYVRYMDVLRPRARPEE